MILGYPSISIDEIRRNYRPGEYRHWFDRETLEFFGELLPQQGVRTFHGVYFITCSSKPDDVTKYTIRHQAIDTGDITTGGAAPRARLVSAGQGLVGRPPPPQRVRRGICVMAEPHYAYPQYRPVGDSKRTQREPLYTLAELAPRLNVNLSTLRSRTKGYRKDLPSPTARLITGGKRYYDLREMRAYLTQTGDLKCTPSSSSSTALTTFPQRCSPCPLNSSGS